MPSKRTEGCLHITCLETLISFQLTCTKTCRFQVFTLSTRRHTRINRIAFSLEKKKTQENNDHKKSKLSRHKTIFFFSGLAADYLWGRDRGRDLQKLLIFRHQIILPRNSHLTPTLNVWKKYVQEVITLR